ncbi:alpha-hydroxy-acid oxidizing protein [Acetobacter oeni]|uniref:alpha-hydroxy-acid oxidizing protein n=1 Tax=Acetobacter oeni TaxID=304077 RepID=UPI0011BD98BD|nr:alpha-hydroxy-acid oxidizing protein [Acetobacter oeni]NHO20565.1 hypothetical protein [Acetobacter oeni]
MTDDGAFSVFSAKARRRLPRLFADYIDGGAHGEYTIARNREAFRRWAIIQRGLRDVCSIDLTTRCFGSAWTMPVFLAPVGFAGMFHAHGEPGAAYAAAQRGARGGRLNLFHRAHGKNRLDRRRPPGPDLRAA